MKVVGVFRELEPKSNSGLTSIYDVRDAMPAGLASAVAAYLKNGEPVFDIMEFTVDPFNPEKGVPGGASLVTDGQWTWRNDLAYYVENYRVALPSEFIKFAMNNDIADMDRSAAIADWKSSVDAYELAIA